MANIVGVREYINQAVDGHGNVLPVGEEPALVATILTATGTSAQHTFNSATKFVFIHTENILNWAMTADHNPTAVIAGAGRLAAEESIFLGIAPPGRDADGAVSPQKIAIIIDT